MTDITIDLNKSEAFVVRTPTTTSDWVAGFLSYQDLVAALGNADERAAGAMLITDPTDFASRLSSIDPTGWWVRDSGIDPNSDSSFTNGPPDKSKTTDPRWPNGPYTNLDGTLTGFGKDYDAVMNYLQYGGKCLVVGRPDNLPETPYNLVETSENLTDTINCFFTQTPSQNITIKQIAEKRGDCMAICQVNVKAPISSQIPDGLPTDDAEQSRITFHVAGQKVHQGADPNYELSITGYAADVAGLMARVRSSNARYSSMAGIDVGNILNVVRSEYNLTANDRSTLAEKKVNPVRTFQGYGTCLYGDTTGNKNISQDEIIFNYANVSLTYLHINQLISNIIRQYMFRENNQINRAALLSAIQSVLARVQSSGGLTIPDGFKVTCDETNNPPSVVLQGNLVVDVVLRFPLSIQKINLSFRTYKPGQTTQTLNTTSGSGSSSSSTSSTSSTSSSGGSSY